MAPPKPTLKTIATFAAKIGATLDTKATVGRITLVAPEGKYWSKTGSTIEPFDRFVRGGYNTRAMASLIEAGLADIEKPVAVLLHPDLAISNTPLTDTAPEALEKAMGSRKFEVLATPGGRKGVLLIDEDGTYRQNPTLNARASAIAGFPIVGKAILLLNSMDWGYGMHCPGTAE